MTYKKRFRKTKNHRSSRENTTHKKKRMHKTTLKKGGTATGTRIFNMLQRKGIDIKDNKKANEIIEGIDDFIKTNNIHAQDTGIIGRKTNALMSSVTGGLDGAIEVIGKWLIPGKPSSGKKNMSEITVYFFPSLVKSKPGDNNKPKLRHGSIMVKTNHQYADISNYVRSMTRDTDDMLAEMVRGVAYPLGRKPYHKERFRISERLDGDWKYTPKGDAAINLMAEKTVNDLKSELDNQKKELQKAKENKESHEKSAKELAKELKKVNADLKKNKGNETKIRELEEEKDAADTKVSELEKKLLDEQAKLSKTNETIKSLEIEKNELYRQLQDTSRSGETSKATITSITEELNKKDLDLEMAKKEKEQSEQNTAQVKAELEEIRGDAKAKEDKLNAAKKDLEAIKQTQTQADATNAAEIERLKSELEKEKDETVRKDQELTEVKTAEKAAKLEKEDAEKVATETAAKLATETTAKMAAETAKQKAEQLIAKNSNKVETLERENKRLLDQAAIVESLKEKFRDFENERQAFNLEERKKILRRIIAEKILFKLKTTTKSLTVSENFIIPDNILDNIRKDIEQYRTAGNAKIVNQELLNRFNTAVNNTDTETNLNSITFKLSSGDNIIDERITQKKTYAQKYTDLFIEAMNPQSARRSDVRASARGPGGGGQGGGGPVVRARAPAAGGRKP